MKELVELKMLRDPTGLEAPRLALISITRHTATYQSFVLFILLYV